MRPLLHTAGMECFPPQVASFLLRGCEFSETEGVLFFACFCRPQVFVALALPIRIILNEWPAAEVALLFEIPFVVFADLTTQTIHPAVRAAKAKGFRRGIQYSCYLPFLCLIILSKFLSLSYAQFLHF